jgi:Fic family protein
MARYIHELADWPDFTWDLGGLASALASVRHRQGRLVGQMQALGFSLRDEANLQTLTQDVLKSSEIEGEYLDPEEVRSSVARRLGIDIGGATPSNRNVDGVVDMMVDATKGYDLPLTSERLFSWHTSLFPKGHSGGSRILVGGWRDDSNGRMRVVSGALGRERVHFLAPPASFVDRFMTDFLVWFDAAQPLDPVIKSAVAHLWFVTIHPFDDGNGRIARAIADLALARSEDTARRFYSMSGQIQTERKLYYELLESTQKGGMDITRWIDWYLGCLNRAILTAEETLSSIIEKAQFWKSHSGADLNTRQRLMLNKALDGFDGNLTTSKWAKITECSNDTALRDILGLVAKDILVTNKLGGRSTSYSLQTPKSTTL